VDQRHICPIKDQALNKVQENIMEDFVVLLKKLMIAENGYTEETANALIKKHPKIIMQGIMRGPFALRAIVMALEMKEEDNKKQKQ